MVVDTSTGSPFQLRETAAQLEMVRQSRWLKLGRQLRLGPQVKEAAAKEAME